MAEYLPFWPKSGMIAYMAASTNQDIYSKALPTNGFTEVVVQVQLDAPIAGDANTTITVYPQISNDGVNWEDQTNFTALTTGGTYPAKEVLKYTEIGAFMRMRVRIAQAAGTSVNAGGTFLISGAGRS